MRKSKNFFVLTLFLISVSLLARVFLLHPTFSDENFYFNVAKNLAEGKILYKDFFFAHPPFQVYILALFFKIFSSSFFVAKIFPVLVSSACVLVVYFISKKIGNGKSGFISCIFFISMPAFLAFSSLEIGVWEAMLFLLLSIYLILDGKLFLSSLSFVVSFFFRYLTILYFPFLFLLAFLAKQKPVKLLIYFFFLFSLFFLTLFSIFGKEYFSQTFFYHFSKAGISGIFPAQYWQLGYFTFFLSLISVFSSYVEKKKILFLFSSIPLITDTFLLIFLRVTFYHYFFFSLPFCVLASAKVWEDSKNRVIKLIIPTIILISIFSNLATLDFYLNPLHAKKFYRIAEFVEENVDKNETIFGEPIATNFASFLTGRRIAANYLDSYLSHLEFEGEEKVIEKLKEEKPKVFIEMKFEGNYYFSSKSSFHSFIAEYKSREIVGGIPTYLLLKF
jgi:4-amino-4-deoxy-L-arabinose transferase-like glycosyltransferase